MGQKEVEAPVHDTGGLDDMLMQIGDGTKSRNDTQEKMLAEVERRKDAQRNFVSTPEHVKPSSKTGDDLDDLAAVLVGSKPMADVAETEKENSLWELVALRCRSHPRLLEGLERMLEHGEWLSTLDLISKRSAFKLTGFESEKRSEVINIRKRISRVKSECLVDVKVFGETPAELLDVYPFNSLVDDYGRQRVRDLEKVRALMDYQFGVDAGSLIPDNARIKKSRATKRIRWIYVGRDMVASVRASDHYIIPHMKLAVQLKDKFRKPRLRVVLSDDEDAVGFVRDGKSVMCKFVVEVDPELRAGDECLVVDKDDNLVRTGTLALSPKEMLDFDRGVAVRVR